MREIIELIRDIPSYAMQLSPARPTKQNWIFLFTYNEILFQVLTLCAISAYASETADPAQEEPPEGYYAFVESPNAEPPRVRPPPYSHAPVDCKEDENKSPHATPFNLCGDLNKGTIPRNPMGQNVMGSPYPLYVIIYYFYFWVQMFL